MFGARCAHCTQCKRQGAVRYSGKQRFEHGDGARFRCELSQARPPGGVSKGDPRAPACQPPPPACPERGLSPYGTGQYCYPRSYVSAENLSYPPGGGLSAGRDPRAARGRGPNFSDMMRESGDGADRG